MAIYIKDSTGTIVSPTEIRKSQTPSALKPEAAWTEEYLSSKGFHIVNETPSPSIDFWDSVSQGAPLRTENEGVITWTQTWSVTTPSLSEVKVAKKKQIDYFRDIDLKGEGAEVATTSLGYEVTWQADEGSMFSLLQAISLYDSIGGTPEGFVWRSADNVNHEVTLGDLIAIGGAIAYQFDIIWKKSWVLKDSLEDLSTVEEVAAIVW